MMILSDIEGNWEEPCLSCEKSYCEDIWGELYCDRKKCIHSAEYHKAKKRLDKESKKYWEEFFKKKMGG